MPGSRVAHRRATPFVAAALAAAMAWRAAPAAPCTRRTRRAREPRSARPASSRRSPTSRRWPTRTTDRVRARRPGRVPFSPRASDRWPIDGEPPRALPAGRATGHADGRRPPTAPPGPTSGHRRRAGDDARSTADAPVDAPAGDAAIPATGASSPAPPAAATDPAEAAGLRRQVFGFLPYWEVSGASSKLNYDVLSTIAYFSVGANARGDLRKRDGDGSLTTGWAGWTSSSMTQVIDQAHARGTRVVLTITAFAWTSEQAAGPAIDPGQPGEPREPRPPGRRRRARPRRRRDQPRLRAARLGLRGRVRRVPQGRARASSTGSATATS